MITCRLCFNKQLRQLKGAADRTYFLCLKCQLISVSPAHFLSASAEKQRYLSHNNGIEHPGYVPFLNRAIQPALPFLDKNMLGLDYGCGYAPTLSQLLSRKGYRCEDYDPFFVQNKLQKTYDYIFSTEVFEHFHHPRKDIEKIIHLLKRNGILIVMTERWDCLERFSNWYYTRDPSHVAFYHDRTFKYICNEFALTKISNTGCRRVLLFRKN